MSYLRQGTSYGQPKNSFQRELEAKVKDRRYGQTEQLSEEDLGSDDDFLAQFNLTSKRKPQQKVEQKSPWTAKSNNNENNKASPKKSALDELFGARKSPENSQDLMKTMKKPGSWQPPTFAKRSYDDSDDKLKSKMRNLEEDETDGKDWRTPLRERDDNSRPRSKSPGLRGRRSPIDLEDIQESPKERPTPKPTPRGRLDESPRPAPRLSARSDHSKSPMSRTTPSPARSEEEMEEKPIETRRRSVLDLFEEDMKEKPKPKVREKRQSHLDDSDSDTGYGSRRDGLIKGQREHAKSPKNRSATPEHGFRPVRDEREKDERPTPARRSERSQDPSPHERMPRDVHKSPAQKRDSSYCEELEREPVKTSAFQAQKEQELDLPEARTTHTKATNEAIAEVGQAQRTLGVTSETAEKTVTVVKPKPRKPQPRYNKPEVASDDKPATLDFNSTVAIREAVYTQWRAERNKQMKEKKVEEAKKRKEEEDKKVQEKQDKYIQSKASYNAWVEKKKDYLQDKQRKIFKQKQKEEKELEEKEQRRKDANATFRSWKEEKDNELYDKKREEKRKEEKKKMKELETKDEKRRGSRSAYKSWKEQKDYEMTLKQRKEQYVNKKKEEEEKRETREQEKRSRQAYESWNEKKEKQDRQEKYKQTVQREEDYEYVKPAWSPAGRTIAFGKAR